MHLPFACALLPMLACVAVATGQNEVAHYHAATAATGSLTGASLTLLQRLPGDQIRGATAISLFSVTLQSQGGSTAQPFFCELRTNRAAIAAGAPDMVAGPLATTGPLSFPSSPIPLAMRFTITLGTPVTFAARRSAPADDLYLAVVLPAVAPGNSPLAVQLSQEAPRPSAIGYGSVAGVTALAWSSVTGSGVATQLPGNVSLDLRTFFVDDVCQPYSQAPNQLPSYGQDGIFPNTAAGNAIGWRVLATKYLGSPALLLAAPTLLPAPVAIPRVAGLLSLDPARLLVLDTGFTLPDQRLPVGTTRVVFGPYTVSLPVTVDAYVQVLTMDSLTGATELSTTSRINL